jgi:transposase
VNAYSHDREHLFIAGTLLTHHSTSFTKRSIKMKRKKGVPMHKIKEVLRLHHSSSLSQRKIATSLNLSVGVVNKYLDLTKQAGITWPLPDEMTNDKLDELLKKTKPTPEIIFAPVDLMYVHQELKRKHMTLQLLWEEYCEKQKEQPNYSYSQFCRLYRVWSKKQSPSMRQTHKAGDKLFIDYVGDTVLIIDHFTGEIRPAQIFVAVMGASNYAYAEATWTQSLPDWIGSHVRAFRFFGGVVNLLVPDNLRSAINKACRYEPEVNRTYADMVTHYNTAVLPARPYKAKDKAKAEGGVLLTQRWILARLRNRQFFSLEELNEAIAELLDRLNHRPFKKLQGNRYEQFHAIDKPALKPLPDKDYEYAEFLTARVNMDYHIEVEKHYYSVPFQLVREEVDVRFNNRIVEIFYHSKRIAIHKRSFLLWKHSTISEHMPKAHQKYAGWSPGSFLNQAIKIGPKTRDVVKEILISFKHPEQSYRSCQGLLSLAKKYSKERLEKACEYALIIGSPRRKSVLSILEKKLDQTSAAKIEPEQSKSLSLHENIRGPEFYECEAEETES